MNNLAISVLCEHMNNLAGYRTMLNINTGCSRKRMREKEIRRKKDRDGVRKREREIVIERYLLRHEISIFNGLKNYFFVCRSFGKLRSTSQRILF